MSLTDSTSIRRDYKLYCKIFEAKNLLTKSKTCDAYCVAMIDHKNGQRTATAWNKSDPFWAEEFFFEDFDHDFKKLELVVWSEQPGSQDTPLGKLVLPRSVLVPQTTATKSLSLTQVNGGRAGVAAEEQWFALVPTDDINSVSGELRVKVSCIPIGSIGSSQIQITVHVIGARNVVSRDINGLSDPYVVLHLMPDSSVSSTKQTKIQKHTLNPAFNEQFDFIVDTWKPGMEIHFSMWDWDRYTEDDFMGHCAVSLPDVAVTEYCDVRSEEWLPLLPKPGHIMEVAASVQDKKKKRAVGGSDQADLSKAKAFVKAIQMPAPADAMPKNKKTHRFVESKNFGVNICGHCSSPIWSLSPSFTCQDCRFCCHAKCQELVLPVCGSVGTIRVSFKYMEEPILPLENYKGLLTCVTAEDHILAALLGRVSGEREDAARILVRLFDARQCAIKFIKACIDHEVAATLDSNTLFRANSMASKVIDVFMKVVGMNYLSSVLSEPIKYMITKNKSCEVDPTRLERGDDAKKNLERLKKFCQEVCNAIFDSTSPIPPSLRLIFSHLQERVKEKFPNDKVAPYTSVGGFIFLRFFAPAVLGPKLFGLWDENLEGKVARALTLVAKTLQNVANLVEFGQKEPYMIPMNIFIVSQFDRVKQYIDKISTCEPNLENMLPKSFIVDVDMAKELSRLYGHFSRAQEKLKENAQNDEFTLVEALNMVLQDLDGQVDEAKLQLKKMNKAQTQVDPMPLDVDLKLLKLNTLGSRPISIMATSKAAATVISQNVSISEKIPHSDSKSSLRSSENVPTPPTLVENSPQPNHAPRSAPSKIQTSPLTKELSNTSQISAELPSSGTADSNHDGNVSPLSPNALERIFASLTDQLNLQAMTPLHNQPLVATAPTTAVATSSGLQSPTANLQLLLELERAIHQATQQATNLQVTQQANQQQLISAISTPTPNEKCAECQLPVMSNDSKSIRQDGKTWHAEHFICHVCRIRQGPLFVKDGFAYCDAHYLQAMSGSMCVHCGQFIAGPFVEAIGKRWHAEHFMCSVCRCPLQNKFFVNDGQPYCMTDHLKRVGLVCQQCQGVLEDEYLEMEGKKYHKHCRVCQMCGASLAGKHFFTLQDKIFCLEHQSNLIICYACQMPITSQALMAVGRSYHPEHFRCAGCQLGFVDARTGQMMPFYEKNQVAYCASCYHRA